MLKGEIFLGKKTIHPFIYLEEIDTDQFKGCILTHSNKYPDNVLLDHEHLEQKNTDGLNFRVKFDNSYFVCSILIKKAEWGPFIKVGQMTDNGINFVESLVSGAAFLITWEEYILI